jgi:N6-adenosine-specific RNA methylase IME4
MKFGTIVADPPWNYNSARSDTRKNRGYVNYRESGSQYPVLDTDSLCALPVGELATNEAVLLLWTTFPFIPDALKVIKAWGFEYVTGLPWVKIQSIDPPVPVYGVGYWFRGAAELVLVGKRKKSYRSNYIGFMSESFEHSRKPDDIHAVAEEIYPGPYLELFARRVYDGWTVVGDEAPGDGGDVRDSLVELLFRK